MPFSQTLLPEFDEEMKNTRKILASVPDGKFDYRPHQKSMTMGQLASHVASLPWWGFVTVDQEELDWQPGMKSFSGGSQAELLDFFDRNVAEAREKITATGDDRWAQTWTFRYKGEVVFALPRSVVMRSSVMSHLVHHRAQLGVYLRLNDVAIAGMYGPSADENKF